MAKAQQVVITIGHISLLLPDDVGVATVLKTLSKGIPVFHYQGAPKIKLQRDEIEVSMTYIKPGTPITDEDGSAVQPKTKEKKARTLELKQPGFLALMEGRNAR